MEYNNPSRGPSGLFRNLSLCFEPFPVSSQIISKHPQYNVITYAEAFPAVFRTSRLKFIHSRTFSTTLRIVSTFSRTLQYYFRPFPDYIFVFYFSCRPFYFLCSHSPIRGPDPPLLPLSKPLLSLILIIQNGYRGSQS